MRWCAHNINNIYPVEASDFFLGFLCNCLRMLDNCEDHFHFYSLYAVHIYDLYHTHIISLPSYNGLELNLHLTCFQRGFIAQLLEHRTSIAEVKSCWSLRFFSGLSLQLLNKLLHNCEHHFHCYSTFFILLRRNKLLVFVSTDTCHNNSQTISNFRCWNRTTGSFIRQL